MTVETDASILEFNKQMNAESDLTKVIEAIDIKSGKITVGVPVEEVLTPSMKVMKGRQVGFHEIRKENPVNLQHYD